MDRFRELFSRRKIRKYLSFFEFYTYVLTRNPKQYEVQKGDVLDQFTIYITPFIYWILSTIIFLIEGHGPATATFVGMGAFMLYNTFLVRNTVSEAYRMELERQQKERNRLQAEKLRRLQEEANEAAKRLEEWARAEAKRKMDEDRRRAEEWLRNQMPPSNPLMPHFRTLGIQPTGDREVIHSAYRKRAKETHPDLTGSEAKFKEVRAAYDTIMKHITTYQKG